MADGYTILVVDDSTSMRRSIRRIIEMCGFPAGRVHEAGDGADALGVLRARWVDVVVTDVNMPRLDGMQLLHEMRADPALAGVPAIVLSSDGSEVRRAAAGALGVVGYLHKPFRPEAMRDALARAVGRAA